MSEIGEITLPVLNTSDQPVSIWWGHTPYYCAPKTITAVPRVVALSIIGHNDYKMLEIQGDDHGIQNAKVQAVKKAGEAESERVKEVLKPWENPTWDPMGANIDVLREYVAAFNLKVPEKADVETIGVIVDEHFMAEQG